MGADESAQILKQPVKLKEVRNLNSHQLSVEACGCDRVCAFNQGVLS